MSFTSQTDISIASHYSAALERKQCIYILATLATFSVLIVDDFIFYMMEAMKVDRECT